MKKSAKKAMGSLLGAVLLAMASVAVQANDGKEAPESQGSIKVAKGTKADAWPGLAKLSLSEAVAAALKKAPGKAVKVELEGDEGSLVYSVEIAGADKQVTEVLVDAGDGKILGVEKGGEDEDKEDPKDGEGDGDD